MDIQRLLKALWRKAWVMLILATLGGVMVVGLIPKPVPTYQAQTTLYVLNMEKILQKGQTLSINDLNYNRQLVENFSELIKSRRVASDAVAILKNSGVDYINEDMLNAMVSLGLQKNSNIIAISATGTDPRMATIISNAMSRAFVDVLNELTNSKCIDILDEAQKPESPLPNNYKIKIGMGILVGLLLGLGIIYLQELFDTTIRSTEDIEESLDLMVIGIIPEHKIK